MSQSHSNQHRSRHHHGGQPPAQWQRQIRTVTDELNDYIAQRNKLKPYQVGLVWNKLGKALQEELRYNHRGGHRINFWVIHSAHLHTLSGHTMKLVSAFNAQSTATVTHSLAKLVSLTGSNLDSVQSLWNALLVRTTVHSESDGFNAQEISNILWAYATADKGKTNKRLLDPLASKAMLRIDDFNPQNLANTAWAYATMDHNTPSLFDAIARTAHKRIDDFNPQNLVNIVWSFAPLNHEAPSLFAAIARTAQKRINDFNPQNLANTVWAFATLNHEVPALFDSIARTAHKRIDEFNAQELANTALAFAKMNHVAPQLCNAIARTTQMHIAEFNAQGLANTAWAFAKMNHEAPSLFDCIARTAHKRIDEFNPQDLANTAWALATMNHEAPSLFDVMIGFVEGHIAEFNAQALANTAWAFSVLNIDTNTLLDPASPFMQTLLSIDQASFSVEELSQLHQFHLWCKEKNTSSWFSDALSCRCLDAFVSREDTSSQLHVDVVASLETLQEVTQVLEEFRTKIGYSVDVVVTYRDFKVGVEVDGPFHYIGQSHARNGNTVLKHRQLRALDSGLLKLVCIPYWEWNEINTGSNKKRNKLIYLQNLLNGALSNPDST